MTIQSEYANEVFRSHVTQQSVARSKKSGCNSIVARIHCHFRLRSLFLSFPFTLSLLLFHYTALLSTELVVETFLINFIRKIYHHGRSLFSSFFFLYQKRHKIHMILKLRLLCLLFLRKTYTHTKPQPKNGSFFAFILCVCR